MSSELVLHLPLNGYQVVDRKKTFDDLSGMKHIAEMHGEVEIVEDEGFGACASIDGNVENYISVPSDKFLKITGDVTVEAWAHVSQQPSGNHYVCLVGKGNDRGSFALYISARELVFQRRLKDIYNSCTLYKPLALNTWYHLAGVVEGKSAFLYLHDLQGTLLAKNIIDDMPSGLEYVDDEPLTIGYHPGEAQRPALTGKMAHVRVYNGARTQEEIERDIAQDGLSLVPFRRSHPIEFRLYDDDDQSVLYINDDPAKHPHLHLELHNTSTQSIQFSLGESHLDAPASPTNHHFAVRFRPGTLSDNTLTWLIDPAKRINNLQSVEHRTDHSTDQWD